MTSQIPLKPHHLFPPKNSKPRIPQQATMDFCKSFPSVHQSSGCCSLPRPIGAVSIFGGTSQIKSTDLTDFLGFWSQQMAKHGGMIFLLLCLFTPAHAEHIYRPACNNRGLKGQVAGDFAGGVSKVSITQGWFSSLVEILMA